MAGSISDDAVIWVAGEATGKDEHGLSASIPASSKLSAGVTVHSGAPSGAPTTGLLYVRTDTRKEYFWDGASWITVSGAP